MSHAYLTQLFNLAAISDKSSRVAKDAEILLKAFGLSSLEEYAGLSSTPEGFEHLRKIQEWWAYNTEMYLSRGTGTDPKAAGVLKKFGAWVRNVYKQYAGGADGYLNLLFRNEFGEDMWKMSDEVRGVMERMFAAESAFIRFEQASGLEPFFKKKPEGMSEDAWSAYLEALEASRLEGIDRLQEASLSQMKWLSGARGRILKEIQSQYSKARRIAKEAAEEAIHAMKCMNLLDDLKEPGREENAEGEALPRPRLKIAAEWLEEQGCPKEQVDKLKRLGVVASEEKGGLPPDVVAGLVGERYEITAGRERADLLITGTPSAPNFSALLRN